MRRALVGAVHQNIVGLSNHFCHADFFQDVTMIFTFWTAPMSVSEPEARRRQAYACRDALKKKSLHKKNAGKYFRKVKNFVVFYSLYLFSSFFMSIGEKMLNTHRKIKTQQTGVENRIAGLPLFKRRERRRPFSPIGPKIKASTMEAGFKSNILIKYPITPKTNMITTSVILLRMA